MAEKVDVNDILIPFAAPYHGLDSKLLLVMAAARLIENSLTNIRTAHFDPMICFAPKENGFSHVSIRGAHFDTLPRLSSNGTPNGKLAEHTSISICQGIDTLVPEARNEQRTIYANHADSIRGLMANLSAPIDDDCRRLGQNPNGRSSTEFGLSFLAHRSLKSILRRAMKKEFAGISPNNNWLSRVTFVRFLDPLDVLTKIGTGNLLTREAAQSLDLRPETLKGSNRFRKDRMRDLLLGLMPLRFS